MPGINKIKNQQQFIDFINNERIKRYNLLLKTPGMANGIVGGLPKSFDKCHCFDICSVNSEILRPYGPIMNKNTIERLIQFVANSDLIIAQRVSNSVLPAIEAFFDLVLITSHRTQNQLEELVSDARQWIENYFREHREAFNKFLRDIFKKILNRFQLIKDDLIRRASQQKTLSNIKLFLQLVIKQEIMKTVVYDAIGSMSKNILDLILSNQNLMNNVTSNEILISALRSDTNDYYQIINDESKNAGILRYFMMQTITVPVLMVTDHLFNPENDDSGEYLLSNLDSQIENNSSINIDTLQETQQYLNDLENQIINSETMFDTTVLTWCTRLKTNIQKQISQQHQAALSVLPIRHQVHQILEKYAQQFIRIECQLQATQHLAKFNGEKPLICVNTEPDPPLLPTVYTINDIIWGSIKNNLFVKRLTTPLPNRPYISYIEAHYHRKITNLNIPNIIKLTYLYENRLSNGSYELWMIFESRSPGIKYTLQNYLDENYQQKIFVSLKKIFQIILPIIDCLVGLHENKLIHRNVKPTNILIDDQEQIYLADLGDWSLSDDEQLDHIELRHQISSNLNSSYDDIKAFGQLCFILCTTVDRKQRSLNVFKDFQQLIESSIRGSLKTIEIRHQLKYLYEKLNHL